MDHIVPILLMCIAACGSEPLNEAHRRRSVYAVYADDFNDEYEPIAVAAVPVHQPVKVYRLISPSQGSQSSTYHGKRSMPRIQPIKNIQSYQSIKSLQSIQPQRDYRDQYVYASASEPEYTYSYEEEYEQPTYASTSTQSKYTKYQQQPNLSSYEEYEAAAPQPVVVYARPNKNGGYSYRQTQRPAAKPQEPVIIRVHKYKVVRD